MAVSTGTQVNVFGCSSASGQEPALMPMRSLTSVIGKLDIIPSGGGRSDSALAASRSFSNFLNFSSPSSALRLAKRSFSSDSILADRAAEGLPTVLRLG